MTTVKCEPFMIYHNNWDEFEVALREYCDRTFQPFRKRSSDSVQAANKRRQLRNSTSYNGKIRTVDTYESKEHSTSTIDVISESYGFMRKVFKCTHGFQIRARGQGKRPRQNYRFLGCEATIQAKLFRQENGEYIVKVVHQTLIHNHKLSEELYRSYSDNRIVADKDLILLEQAYTTQIHLPRSIVPSQSGNGETERRSTEKEEEPKRNHMALDSLSRETIHLPSEGIIQHERNRGHHEHMRILPLPSDSPILSIGIPPLRTLSSNSNASTSFSGGTTALNVLLPQQSECQIFYPFVRDEHIRSRLSDPSLLLDKAFVNGEWVVEENHLTFPVVDPGTSHLITELPDLSYSAADLAVEAANTSLEYWGNILDIEQRANFIKRWHDLVTESTHDIALLLIAESGKPFNDAIDEVQLVLHYMDYCLRECILYKPLSGSTNTIKQHKVLPLQRPSGVLAIFLLPCIPLLAFIKQIIVALACGCTLVLIPSSKSPLSPLALVKLCLDAAFPKGVVNVLTTKIDLRQYMMGHPLVSRVFLEEDDAQISQSFIMRFPLKISLHKHDDKVPAVVFDDANLIEAVACVLSTRFFFNNHPSLQCKRVFVQSSIHDEFVNLLTNEVRNLKCGVGWKCRHIQIGPLNGVEEVLCCQNIMIDAIQKGADIRCGGKVNQELGANFYEPTVVCNVNKRMQIFSKMYTGPLVPIIKFSTEEELIQEYFSLIEAPITIGYFHAGDANRIWNLSKHLKCSTINVNTSYVNVIGHPLYESNKEKGHIEEFIKESMKMQYMVIGGIEE